MGLSLNSIFVLWIYLSDLMYGESTVLPVITRNDTQVIDVLLPYVKIPQKETYYVCQQFQIEDDKAYHITKFEPIINNTDAVHHMLLFGCEFKIEEGPHPCDSLDYRCRTWLVKWDIGMTQSIRMPPDAGVRVGKGSFKYILLQIHWNNVGAQDDRTDSSGMRLHVTDNLFPHDIGNVQIGQNSIEIPRERDDILISGACSSTCTRLMLPLPIYITDIYLHMHELGARAAVDIHREREVTDRIVFEDNYNYTRPVWHSLDPPAVLYPGESIEMLCWYDSSIGSRLRNHTVTYGQGANLWLLYEQNSRQRFVL